MKNSVILAGALGVVIVGTVALAQTTAPGQAPPPATTAGVSPQDTRTPTQDGSMIDRNTASSSTMNNANPGAATPNNARSGYGAGAQTSPTAMPYNNQADSTMAGAAQTSAQDGSASQWAGERG